MELEEFLRALKDGDFAVDDEFWLEDIEFEVKERRRGYFKDSTARRKRRGDMKVEKIKEVFRSSQPDIAHIHRVVRDKNGKFLVEFPIVNDHHKIEHWNYVGGGPGMPNPTYNTMEEAKAFIEGIENGLQKKNVTKAFKGKRQQRAYDEGLKFGLEL